MNMPVMTTRDLKYALVQLRAQLRKKLDDGTDCPLCGQHAKIYRRKINSTLAKALITMYRTNDWLPDGGSDYMHVPSLPGDTHEASQLSWWGLIDEEVVRRPDGGRAGYWRLTWRGRCFVENKIKLPKYAEVYNGKVVGMDSSEMVTIKDALSARFNYSDLMTGV